MVLLWIVKGLVQSSSSPREEIMEEIGDDYFLELLSRSLIQPFKNYGNRFVMYDLVHDLATIVFKRNYFWCDGNKIIENIWHLSYKQGFDDSNIFENINNLKHLRSFLPLGCRWNKYYLSEKVLCNTFSILNNFYKGFMNKTIIFQHEAMVLEI